MFPDLTHSSSDWDTFLTTCWHRKRDLTQKAAGRTLWPVCHRTQHHSITLSYQFLVTSPPTKHLEALLGIAFSITTMHDLQTAKLFYQLHPPDTAMQGKQHKLVAWYLVPRRWGWSQPPVRHQGSGSSSSATTPQPLPTAVPHKAKLTKTLPEPATFRAPHSPSAGATPPLPPRPPSSWPTDSGLGSFSGRGAQHTYTEGTAGPGRGEPRTPSRTHHRLTGKGTGAAVTARARRGEGGKTAWVGSAPPRLNSDRRGKASAEPHRLARGSAEAGGCESQSVSISVSVQDESWSLKMEQIGSWFWG